MGTPLSYAEKAPKANKFLSKSGDKARAGKKELEQFKSYQSARDSDGTITSYKGVKRASNLVALNDTNPLIRGAKRTARMIEGARIARRRAK